MTKPIVPATNSASMPAVIPYASIEATVSGLHLTPRQHETLASMDGNEKTVSAVPAYFEVRIGTFKPIVVLDYNPATQLATIAYNDRTGARVVSEKPAFFIRDKLVSDGIGGTIATGHNWRKKIAEKHTAALIVQASRQCDTSDMMD